MLTQYTDDLGKTLQMTLMRDNTNFESLIGKLENNTELYDFVFDIVMNEREYSYNPHEKMMRSSFMYGILKKENGGVKVHNRLYEQIIYNYMVARIKDMESGCRYRHL